MTVCIFCGDPVRPRQKQHRVEGLGVAHEGCVLGTRPQKTIMAYPKVVRRELKGNIVTTYLECGHAQTHRLSKTREVCYPCGTARARQRFENKRKAIAGKEKAPKEEV